MSKRSDLTYIWLERIRAGLGSAGIIAVLAETISSSKVFLGAVGLSWISGGIADILIAVSALFAFAAGLYVVDVPSSREKDADR